MINAKQQYDKQCETESDINEHLPTLLQYAKECDHVTEFGVRWVVSTYAFMCAQPKKMISYDIIPIEQYGISREQLTEAAKEENCDFEFIQANTLELEIDLTDLLFIDTQHDYQQLKSELNLHANKVNKYIILHDTVTFGEKDEVGDGPGLLPAMNEFLEQRGDEWAIKEVFTNNNGLTVLERI